MVWSGLGAGGDRRRDACVWPRMGRRWVVKVQRNMEVGWWRGASDRQSTPADPVSATLLAGPEAGKGWGTAMAMEAGMTDSARMKPHGARQVIGSTAQALRAACARRHGWPQSPLTLAAKQTQPPSAAAEACRLHSSLHPARAFYVPGCPPTANYRKKWHTHASLAALVDPPHGQGMLRSAKDLISTG